MDEATQTHARPWLWTTLAIVMLPIAYTLSIGPVFYYMEKHHSSGRADRWLQTFYGPLIWVHENTPLKRPLDAYTDWWMHLAHQT